MLIACSSQAAASLSPAALTSPWPPPRAVAPASRSSPLDCSVHQGQGVALNPPYAMEQMQVGQAQEWAAQRRIRMLASTRVSSGTAPAAD